MPGDRETPWEEIEHTADWALRVWGADLPALFENAARGMVSLVGGTPDLAQPASHRAFSLQAPDDETLLIDWLTELIFLVEDEQIIFTEITVRRLENRALEAEAAGYPGRDIQKHIKAATYHNLVIRQAGNQYETVIVFDV